MREEARDEHPVVVTAGPSRVRIRSVWRHDKVSADVPSFGALPRGPWMVLGILELVCTVGLIVPAAFHRRPTLTVVAATVLAIESLVLSGCTSSTARPRPLSRAVCSGGHAAMRPLAIQSLYWYVGCRQPPELSGTDETTPYRSSPFCFRYVAQAFSRARVCSAGAIPNRVSDKINARTLT